MGYPEACSILGLGHLCILGLGHLLYSTSEMSLIERVVECMKHRTEAFEDYYPCMREERVYKWTGLFVFMYNAVRVHIKFRLLTHLIGGDIR
jgi:hypothetical protein